MPNTIAENLQRLVEAKTDIADAITAKGGTVNSGDGLEEFASDIATIPNSYTQTDEGKVVSNGSLVAQTSATYTKNGTYNTTTKNSVTVAVPPPVSSPSVTLGVGNARTCMRPFGDTWTTKAWNGLSSFGGRYVWTDGYNIYYSSSSTQYVLDKATSTWTVKNWNGLYMFAGNCIWTDGDNIYYSSSSTQYVLDKATSTWTAKTWNGLSSIDGDYIWTDGDNIYYSRGEASSQYVLDKATSTWVAKSWNGYSSISGRHIWTDGDNIYYSLDMYQYVLDKSTSTWTVKNWNGYRSTYCNYIWTDGDSIYYSVASFGSHELVLDKSTSTWTPKTWSGLSSFDGDCIWTDGDDIYYSNGSTQYVLTKSPYIARSIPSARPTKAITAT